MVEQQCTIKKSVSLSGVGIHTGTECTMTFNPAPENYGIRFIRVDLGGSPEIPAIVDNVVDISRGTTLAIGEAKVHTVEHVLSAVYGLKIDNIRIELDGIEPPIGDGSSRMYVDSLLEAGIEKQNSPKDYLVIDQTVMYQDEQRGVDIVALPLDDFRVSVMIDYHNPALGSQHSSLFSLEKEFIEEYSASRTFCFLSEVEQLVNQNLIQGGDIDNAIVIVDKEMEQKELDSLLQNLKLSKNVILGDNGILNNEKLRFKNEPARHKVLDLIGDLALIGAPLKAQILAARPGHKANVEFARQIRKLYQQKKLEKKYQFVKKEGVIFDANAILRILPHRYPFVMVDKIVELKMGERVVGVKSVTINEQFFTGHFPGQMVMPGILILEALAQSGGILLLNSIDDFENNLVYFMAINNAKFRKPVVPGDQLILEVDLVNQRSKTFMMKGRALVDGNVVAEADFMAAVVPKEQKK
ncbi:MAG: bifunctional UDP-3-O-[3-hydroxymyristoyl] N-acetylglucosamine deacetylase/3-hydroxyacyl-ACP dehydratase [Ignavibacteria bacterium]|nr:bifunctional UDP-3-O-[3-hydroxymyristoyl] N-acetylglucosamine deacetylase/3-hydroxyacyl-ACP dehydratase [Ignavibacteria bacterium]